MSRAGYRPSVDRDWGAISFDYFSLGKQRKVRRQGCVAEGGIKRFLNKI
jgi:hypothetical protein